MLHIYNMYDIHSHSLWYFSSLFILVCFCGVYVVFVFRLFLQHVLDSRSRRTVFVVPCVFFLVLFPYLCLLYLYCIYVLFVPFTRFVSSVRALLSFSVHCIQFRVYLVLFPQLCVLYLCCLCVLFVHLFVSTACARLSSSEHGIYIFQSRVYLVLFICVCLLWLCSFVCLSCA